MTTRLPGAAAAVLLAALLAACSPGADVGSPPRTVADLASGSPWRAISIAGRPTVERSEPSLSFMATDINGNSGCNQFFGTYTYADGSIDITTGGMTMMACEEPLTAMESAFIAALDGVQAASIDEAGQLLLSGSGGDILFAAPGVVPGDVLP